MQYTVYDKNTGEILRSGVCPEDQVELQLKAENETLLAGEAVNDEYFTINPETQLAEEKLPEV